MDLIGRDRERQEIARRLRERRLVTLLGPAGIGKTALALSVARDARSAYALGAHHVDLTRVDDPADVADSIAAQLGFRSFDALVGSPTEQPALLVVDNCEHVTAGAADAIGELLDACEAPTVLATSRSPLGVEHESLLVIGPLGLPPVGVVDEEVDSVRLFLERARDAGATITGAQLPAVVELCRRLDGLPLAIELAAARTRMLQPAEILERLAHGVDVLARPRGRGDKRHQSLGETIAWSYHLLPDPVTRFLDRLSLFAGPFPAAMATAVAADTGIDAFDAGAALELLIDSSLVMTEPSNDMTQYRILQTVRAYGVARLRERGEEHDARRRLGDHVLAAATDLLLAGGHRWNSDTLARLLALYETIASTLRWSLEHDDEPERSLLLCSVLWGVVHQGHTEEIAALCEAALARWPDPTAPFAADAAATTATARCLLGDHTRSRELAEHALAHVGGSKTAPVTLRRVIALAARARGDRALAITAFSEVSTLARSRGLLALAIEADVSRAQLLAATDVHGAYRLAAAAAEEAADAGSTVNEVWARTVAALVLLRIDRSAGTAAVEDALAAARRIDYPVGISAGLRSLAWVRTIEGDFSSAAVALVELFDDLIGRSGTADLRGALQATAELLHACGDPSWSSIAATAASLPLVGVATTALDVDPSSVLPFGDVPPLSRRDAIVLARTALRRVVSDERVPVRTTAAAVPVAAAVRARFIARGGYYDISFAGREAHIRASKGLDDVVRLLATPGHEIHCTDLIGAVVDQSSVDVIDDTARRRYETRIRELQGDIDEAESHNDLVRAERAQAELDALVDHLTNAMGLGGRFRRTGSTAERARSAVTQRIRGSIRRLAPDHPELARHLEHAIVTGVWCAYRPEHPVEWEVSGPGVTS